MANYMRKYVGTYRVIADYNQATGDFPRNQDGEIDKSFDDMYIACIEGNQIYSYGKGVLVGYVPSLGRGRNVLKTLYQRQVGGLDKFVKQVLQTKGVNKGKVRDEFDCGEMYAELIERKILIDVEETSEEVLFKFKATMIDLVAELLQAKKKGASTQPFSSNNLRKTKYGIPAEEMADYKEITKVIPKTDSLVISRINDSFLTEIAQKSLKKRGVTDIGADMLLLGLKGKDYIHHSGLWSEYLEYLRKKVEEIYNG